MNPNSSLYPLLYLFTQANKAIIKIIIEPKLRKDFGKRKYLLIKYKCIVRESVENNV